MNVGVFFEDFVDEHSIEHAELEHHDAGKYLKVSILDILEGQNIWVVVHVDQLQHLHGDKAPSNKLYVHEVTHDLKNEHQHDARKSHLVNRWVDENLKLLLRCERVHDEIYDQAKLNDVDVVSDDSEFRLFIGLFVILRWEVLDVKLIEEAAITDLIPEALALGNYLKWALLGELTHGNGGNSHLLRIY